METYYDEREYYISSEDLFNNYLVLKANAETDCETFEDYIRECCSKNGTLTKVER